MYKISIRFFAFLSGLFNIALINEEFITFCNVNITFSHFFFSEMSHQNSINPLSFYKTFGKLKTSKFCIAISFFFCFTELLNINFHYYSLQSLNAFLTHKIYFPSYFTHFAIFVFTVSRTYLKKNHNRIFIWKTVYIRMFNRIN